MELDEPFVPVWEGPYLQAQEKMRTIESAAIPVDLDDALVVGHARVVVPRSYVDEANAALAGINARWPELDAPPAPDETGSRPLTAREMFLYALVIVVLIGIFASYVIR